MPAEADHRREMNRLREGMVVELDRRFPMRGDRSEAKAPRPRSDIDVEDEVATTITTVRQVASVLVDLQDTIRRQEELLDDQRQSIAELQKQKQAVLAELAHAERDAKAERERAERAEQRAQTGEAQIRRLENYSVSLKSHLNSLMSVVRESLAIDPASATGNRPSA